MPLPLTSLVFGGELGGDVDTTPAVLEIAEILAATTLIGGEYQFYGHSYFWYAYTAYDADKRQFGKGQGKEVVMGRHWWCWKCWY